MGGEAGRGKSGLRGLTDFSAAIQKENCFTAEDAEGAAKLHTKETPRATSRDFFVWNCRSGSHLTRHERFLSTKDPGAWRQRKIRAWAGPALPGVWSPASPASSAVKQFLSALSRSRGERVPNEAAPSSKPVPRRSTVYFPPQW